jgi:hypothetical protein
VKEIHVTKAMHEAKSLPFTSSIAYLRYHLRVLLSCLIVAFVVTAAGTSGELFDDELF